MFYLYFIWVLPLRMFWQEGPGACYRNVGALLQNAIKPNLKELRTAAFCTMGFAGFLRFDELKTMMTKQIKFHDEYMKMVLPIVPKTKTDA